MSKRSTSTDKILIDPLFVLPEGAEDYFEHSRETVDTNVYVPDGEEIAYASDDTNDFLTEEEFEYDEGFYDDEPVGELETPDGFIVISQTLRRAPGGMQVVDLVVEVPDVDGADNYEFQVTKA